jgi:hypothetical protein
MADPAQTASGAALQATPPSTLGFGPRESADETRQAQHSVSNDAPTDINFNAVVARSQQLTLDTLGKNYEANADRRTKIADAFMGKSLEKSAT